MPDGREASGPCLAAISTISARVYDKLRSPGGSHVLLMIQESGAQLSSDFDDDIPHTGIDFEVRSSTRACSALAGIQSVALKNHRESPYSDPTDQHEAAPVCLRRSEALCDGGQQSGRIPDREETLEVEGRVRHGRSGS